MSAIVGAPSCQERQTIVVVKPDPLRHFTSERYKLAALVVEKLPRIVLALGGLASTVVLGLKLWL